jgi:hypothetical protein
MGRDMLLVIKIKETFLWIYGKELSRMHVKGFVLFELEGSNVAACL